MTSHSYMHFPYFRSKLSPIPIQKQVRLQVNLRVLVMGLMQTGNRSAMQLKSGSDAAFPL